MTDDQQTELLRSAPPALLDVDVCRALGSAVAFRADDDESDSDDNSPGTMVGHFSTFNDWYEINSWFEGNFLERIAPGAFKRTIKGRGGSGGNGGGETPIRVLLDHGFDPELGDKPLGVPRTLEERDQGPYAEVPLFDGVPQLVVSGLRAGAYGQSFRFQVLRDEWVEEPDPGDHNPKGIPERTIKEVRLIEFGPTPFPANPAADAGLRSTTDDFYARLRRRDQSAYDAAVARAHEVRIPKTPAPAKEPESKSKTEDPPSKALPGPADTGAPSPVPDRHSEDPPKPKHSKAPSDPTNKKTRSTTMDESMTVEERGARQAEIRARLTEIDTEYNGAALPDEVQTEWDSLNEELDTHSAAIVAANARRARLAQIDPERAGERARPSYDMPQVTPRKVDNIFDLAQIRQQARSMDELCGLYRDYALRAIEQARFSGAKDRASAQATAERLLRTVDDEYDEKSGNQGATLARRILSTGSPTYDRAFGKAVKALHTNGLTADEQRALSLGTDGSGGFAVPFDLDPTIMLTSAGATHELRSFCRVEQIVGKEWQGITSAGVTATRRAEAAEVGDNTPTVAQPTVRTTRVDAFVPFSMEIEASWSQMRSEVTMLLSDAKHVEEADSFINGNGTPPNPNGLVATLAAASEVVANTITAAVIYDLEAALPPRFRESGRFLANHSIYNAVRQIDTQGGSALWARIGEGQPAGLLGYPSAEASAMATGPTGVGVRWLVFGDFSKFLIVDRIGMNVELVPHLLGANRRPTGERGILAVWMNNCKVLVDNAFRIAERAA